jgi:hypothetical protein
MDTSQFIDTEKGIVYTTVTGEVTLREISADMAQLADDPSYRPDMPGLVDLRGATKVLDAEETVQFAQFIKSSPRVVNHARRALLVGSDLSYGMCRMFEAMAEDGTVQHRVFRDEAEARAWVEEAAAAVKK